MAEGEVAVKDKIAQLNQARALVLQDPAYYPDILNGILPIIVAPSSVIELRRWGSDFLAETFSSPLLATQKKQELALTCLSPLLTLMGEVDTSILKNVIQCSSSIYPLVFRYICHNKAETATWQQMVAIKSKILSMLDTGTEGVRLACIKFVQRIILVQTPGASDPRLVDKSEVSLTIVPLNHPTLNIHALEAEAHGLLDRILIVFQDGKLDAPAISAILNCLPALVKGRAVISNKILNVLMAYNPLAIAAKSTVFKERFIARSLEKTVRMTLTHLARASSQGPHSAKIHQQIQRLLQAKSEFSIEPPKNNKRVLTGTDADPHKRAKYTRNNDDSDYTPTPPPAPPPIQVQPSNGTTYKTLFTLTGDQGLSNFDVSLLPVDVAAQIVVATLFATPPTTLEPAINSVRQRLASLVQAAAQVPPPRPPQPPQLEDDDDDYTPGVSGDGASSQSPLPHADNVMYSEDSDDSYEVKDVIPIIPHNKAVGMDLVKMPLLSQEEIQEACEGTLDRMFETIGVLDKPTKKEKTGVNRLAATNLDRDGWLTILSRLGTRGLSGIDAEIQAVAKDDRMHYETISSQVRQRMFLYVMGDFRSRMDAAVSWLNEEWYNDKIQAISAKETGDEKSIDPQYPKWMVKVMEGIFPYLETTDRNIFLRFLSELPAIPPQVLANIRGMCLDPERTSLGFLAFQYLCMLKPPVRQAVLDIVEELWHNHNDIKATARKLLAKFRPHVVGLPAKEATANGS